MKVTEFAEVVADLEGKKKQISIAQIKEVLKIINTVTDGMLYMFIREM
jgi:hypothetical protein